MIFDDEDEIWEEIPGFPDYEVSTHGRVRNVNSLKVVKAHMNTTETLCVTLRRNNKSYGRAVGVLVANAFIHIPTNAEVIHYVDGDRSNCHYENLRWKTRWWVRQYNKEQASERPMRNAKLYSLDTGEEFENSRDAANKLGVLEQYVVASAGSSGTITSAGHRLVYSHSRSNFED